MSVIEDLPANNATYAGGFPEGGLPLPPARGVAVLACRHARLDPARPSFPLEALSDLDRDVPQSIARLKVSPFLSVDDVPGFVYDVASGRLREVT